MNRTHASFLNSLAALKRRRGRREGEREKGKDGGGWVIECWSDLECHSQVRKITQFIAPSPHPYTHTDRRARAHTRNYSVLAAAESRLVSFSPLNNNNLTKKEVQLFRSVEENGQCRVYCNKMACNQSHTKAHWMHPTSPPPPPFHMSD